ncbi:OprD family outer membrane porin [Parendozoicomonas sp. Alg238-R29]|uniref:OprD family outer membrane porin n=1 Tax=Parendozoicomonas sp. Alg238-R29 TaxID=2993446 RepID=UPI00248F40F2|nr:OprD family outer membrane porin [Parendozoicomonas sp. Alg238-R29]
MKKLALAIAVATAAAASASAQAAEAVTFDPSLKLTYKNYFWKQKDDASSPKYYRDEWVQALVADFDTGYVNDMVGVVVTAGFANNLKTKDDTSITNLGKNSDGEATDISGFQQAYLKAKYDFGELALKGTVGVKKRGYELYGNSGSRILNASSNGVDVSAAYKDLTVYASQITGASSREDSSFSNDLTVNTKRDENTNALISQDKVDHIRILGANYTIAGIDFTAERLESKDYLAKNFVKAAYTFDLGNGMTLDTDVRYGEAEDNGDLYNGTDDKYESSYYNANATLNFDNAYVGFGYNKVSDGDFETDDSEQGNAGTFNTTLSQWSDYNKEGERAYVVTAGYNFADLGLSGLNIDMVYAEGKDAKNYDNFGRQEFSSYVSYKFDGQLEGLSVAWLHVTSNADGVNKTDSDDNLKNRDRSNRLYLKYSVSVF